MRKAIRKKQKRFTLVVYNEEVNFPHIKCISLHESHPGGHENENHRTKSCVVAVVGWQHPSRGRRALRLPTTTAAIQISACDAVAVPRQGLVKNSHGPYRNSYFFIAIDAFFKLIEVFPISSPSVECTIACM